MRAATITWYNGNITGSTVCPMPEDAQWYTVTTETALVTLPEEIAHEQLP